ncbi:gluconokinase [Nocardioides pakistanensis]
MTRGPLHVVVMGVSATGKTSVARRLAQELGWPFEEGDDHHPPRNIDKMAAGVPLDDDDRRPWLESLAGLLARDHAAGRSSVLTCSALRRSYRDILRGNVPTDSVYFVHLAADFDVLHARMARRQRHFMPASLLQSQFETLEPLEPDERGVRVDVAAPLADVVEQALAAVRSL